MNADPNPPELEAVNFEAKVVLPTAARASVATHPRFGATAFRL
jgi:hypothetical protein